MSSKRLRVFVLVAVLVLALITAYGVWSVNSMNRAAVNAPLTAYN